jgi:lactoylglutathione lyase
MSGRCLLSAPRMTGDGFFETVIADPDGNRIELVGA